MRNDGNPFVKSGQNERKLREKVGNNMSSRDGEKEGKGKRERL